MGFKVHDDERKAVEQALRSLGEQLSAATVAREHEAGRLSDIQEQNKELRFTVDRLRNQASIFFPTVPTIHFISVSRLKRLKLKKLNSNSRMIE